MDLSVRACKASGSENKIDELLLPNEAPVRLTPTRHGAHAVNIDGGRAASCQMHGLESEKRVCERGGDIVCQHQEAAGLHAHTVEQLCAALERIGATAESGEDAARMQCLVEASHREVAKLRQVAAALQSELALLESEVVEARRQRKAQSRTAQPGDIGQPAVAALHARVDAGEFSAVDAVEDAARDAVAVTEAVAEAAEATDVRFLKAQLEEVTSAYVVQGIALQATRRRLQKCSQREGAGAYASEQAALAEQQATLEALERTQRHARRQSLSRLNVLEAELARERDRSTQLAARVEGLQGELERQRAHHASQLRRERSSERTSPPIAPRAAHTLLTGRTPLAARSASAANRPVGGDAATTRSRLHAAKGKAIATQRKAVFRAAESAAERARQEVLATELKESKQREALADARAHALVEQLAALGDQLHAAEAQRERERDECSFREQMLRCAMQNTLELCEGQHEAELQVCTHAHLSKRLETSVRNPCHSAQAV
eukprot:583725-Pleurochrysis_carterae.AAC.4